MAAIQSRRVVVIPLRQADDEAVEIPLDNLPEVRDVIDILRTEMPPLQIWLALAVSSRWHEFLVLAQLFESVTCRRLT